MHRTAPEREGDIGELVSLRKRAFELFPMPPPTRDFDWELSSFDATRFVDCYRPLRLRPGYELCVYELSFAGNCSTRLYALPRGAARPEPQGRDDPRPPAALGHFMEAIEGDGTPWSYLLASFLSRDGEELGAVWHGCYWRTHALLLESPFWEASRIQAAAALLLEAVETSGLDGIEFFARFLPGGHKIIGKKRRKQRQGKAPSVTAQELWGRITWTSSTLMKAVFDLRYRYERGRLAPPLPRELEALDDHDMPTSEPGTWEWREPLPTTWQPEVDMGHRIEVVFYTYSGWHRQKIIRHRDVFSPGSYCPERHDEEIGLGTDGYIF